MIAVALIIASTIQPMTLIGCERWAELTSAFSQLDGETRSSVLRFIRDKGPDFDEEISRIHVYVDERQTRTITVNGKKIRVPYLQKRQELLRCAAQSGIEQA